MPESLQDLLKRLRDDRILFLSGEAAVKQGAVLPILSQLGWDTFNVREVTPEFAVGDGRVDYCLLFGDRKAAFLAVKRVNEDLEDHQEQLLEYAFRDAVQIAALTNGLSWWLYLPLSEGSWEQRKFFTIDIQQQDLASAEQHFREFLGRDAIASGRAVERGRAVQQGIEKMRAINAALPKAWYKMRKESDEQLLELLADRVDKLCGHKPDDELLADFLAGTLGQPPTPSQLDRLPREKKPVRAVGPGKPGIYTHTRPVAFSFQGVRKTVTTYKEILLALCQILLQAQPSGFERVLSLRGRKRHYFSYDLKTMKSPQPIPGTRIYVETNLSANSVVELCHDIIALFGHKPEDLRIESHPRTV